VIFESSPVIPAAFLLHEWKFESTHEIFMACIKDKLTSSDNLKPAVLIVTDDEKAVCNAIDKTLSGALLKPYHQFSKIMAKKARGKI